MNTSAWIIRVSTAAPRDSVPPASLSVDRIRVRSYTANGRPFHRSPRDEAVSEGAESAAPESSESVTIKIL